MMDNATRVFDFPYIQLEKYNLKQALVTKYNGKWVSTSSQEFVDQINIISRALLRMGVKKNDKIAIISSTNRTEWNIMDHGILQIGAVNVPIYPTITVDEYAYIFEHSESVYCFVSDEKVYKKTLEAQKKVNNIKEIYAFDEIDGCKNWKELLELGKEDSNQEEVEQHKTNVTPDDLASIIYTSGTTGKSKGVMLSHRNFVSDVIGTTPLIPFIKGKSKFFSFLPVCHSFERTVQYICINSGVSLSFAESLDSLLDNIKDIKPDIMTAVPRLLEKIYDGIIDKGKELKGFKNLIFFWATGLGIKYEPYGKNGWWYETKLKVARKLVFNKWKEALGGQIRIIVSGSASLQKKLVRMYTAAGIPVAEGYGLTEASPIIAANDYYNESYYRVGSVGPLVDGIEVKIADDGEILCKGPIVMLGYYKDPELTKETIVDGWLHTGDKGHIDKDGFLFITGRKKEIFKTSGGKYVSPALIENEFRKSHFIEQLVVVGEGEKMPAALIQPDFEFIKAWGKHKGYDLPQNNEDIIQHPKVVKRIQKDVDHYNERFAKWERVKKIELVPDEWTIDNRLLTPTLKTKRKAIIRHYKDLYDRIYEA